jgi:tagatose 6-phosphate kinase
MILCIAPSPAIDRTARVERFAEGVVLRPAELVVLPGGKAITTARAARALGAIVATTGYAGGHAGRWIVEALAAEGLNPSFVETAAESRTTYVLLDARGKSLLVYEAAPPVTEAEAAELHQLLEAELLPAAEFVVIAGSFPPDSPTDAGSQLVELVHRAGRRCLVDTSGRSILAVAAAGPDVLKISLEEALSAGLATSSDPAPAQAATERLSSLGVGLAVVTDGSRGASAFDGSSHWRIQVPAVAATSAVGSGDAFNGGLAVALADGRPPADALAHGAAAGTANAQSLGGGRFSIEAFETVLGAVQVERVRSRRMGGRAHPQGHV